MSDDRFSQLRLMEAILFAAPGPMAEKVLADHLSEGADIKGLLSELKDLYANRGIHLVHIGEGWGFRTAPDLAERLKIERKISRKLSRAAIETLAIVAYHQPVTRAEIEEIRGVVISKGTLDTLLEAGWIKPKGRKQTPGRPVTWVTTEAFLDHFGLENLDALPGMEELRAAGLLDARAGVSTLGTQSLTNKSIEESVEESEAQEEEQEADGESDYQSDEDAWASFVEEASALPENSEGNEGSIESPGDDTGEDLDEDAGEDLDEDFDEDIEEELEEDSGPVPDEPKVKSE